MSKRLLEANNELLKCLVRGQSSSGAAPPTDPNLAQEATLQTVATETTLQTVSNTLTSLLAENKLDFELRSVVDDNGDVFQLRGTLDEETGVYSWDYIDAAGAVAVPVAPVEFINPEGLLTVIYSELQTLNATDFATAASQALALAELQTLNAKDFATETTLALLVPAVETPGFVQSLANGTVGGVGTRSFTIVFRGSGGTLNLVPVPDNFTATYGADDNNTFGGGLPYTIPTGGEVRVLIASSI